MSGESAVTIEEWETLDLLAHLVQKSLVLYDEKTRRYLLLETVEEYSREKLQQRGEGETVRNDHLNFFLALAEEAASHWHGEQQPIWMARFEAEQDNLRAALTWSTGQTRLRLAARLFDFWYQGGYFTEARQWLVLALEDAGAQEPTLERAQALTNASSFAFLQGEYETALSFADQGRKISAHLDAKPTLLSALNNLGLIARCQAAYAEAWAYHQQSLAIAREIGSRRGEASALGNMGLLAQCQGDLNQASALIQDGLTLMREIEDKQGIALYLSYQGMIKHFQGENELAAQICHESLQQQRELQDKRALSEGLAILGIIECCQGKLNRAACLFGSVQMLLERLNTQFPTSHRVYYEEKVAVTQAGLGEETFASYWADGHAMTIEQVLDYALETSESHSH